MPENTTNALAVMERPQAITTPKVPSGEIIEDTWRLAQYAAKSGMARTGDPYEAHFRIMYGWELGLSPMASLRTLYSVHGTPTCSGEAMLALIRRSGLAESIVWGKCDHTEANITMTRKDTGESYSAHFTIDKAARAGLAGKDIWKKYPDKMLKWRAVSEVGKFLFSDVLGGLYTVEELAPDTELNQYGEPVGEIIQGDFSVSGEEKVDRRKKVEGQKPLENPIITDEPTALTPAQVEGIRKKGLNFGFDTDGKLLEVLQTAYPDRDDIYHIKDWPGDDIEADAAILCAFYHYDRPQIEKFTSGKSGERFLDMYHSAMEICGRVEKAASEEPPVPASSKVTTEAAPADKPDISDADIEALKKHAENLGASETLAMVWLEIDDWQELPNAATGFNLLNTASIEGGEMVYFDLAQRVHKNYWHAIVNPGKHQLCFRIYSRDSLREMVTKLDEDMRPKWQAFIDALDEVGGDPVETPDQLYVHGWEAKPSYLLGKSVSLSSVPF